jgi:type I restriction enzyme M protein
VEKACKYFTGTALTQLSGENVKYLDSNNANAQKKKHLEALAIYKGYILVSDSGTIARVTYALNMHDGHVTTNNLIRIVIEDEYLLGLCLSVPEERYWPEFDGEARPRHKPGAPGP